MGTARRPRRRRLTARDQKLGAAWVSTYLEERGIDPDATDPASIFTNEDMGAMRGRPPKLVRSVVVGNLSLPQHDHDVVERFKVEHRLSSTQEVIRRVISIWARSRSTFTTK